MRALVLLLIGFVAGSAGMYWLITSGTLVLNPDVPSPAQTARAASAPGPPADPHRTADRVAVPPPDPGTLDIALPLADLSKASILDTFDQARGTDRKHEATDIMAPRGTPVHAVADGKIEKLFLSKAGGLTIYQFDKGEQFCFYYAHLDRYHPGITEGIEVRRGEVIAYVGSTGNADPNAPHLHFAIFQLSPEKRWWEGTPVNPYPHLMAAVGKGLH
jgi:murein DD-endopeptidase MepM/ murein hydrolase activator NlpD